MTLAAVSTILLSPLSASSGAARLASERDLSGLNGMSFPSVTLRGLQGDAGSNPASGSRSETCRSARTGLAWYRQRERDWLKLRGKPSQVALGLRNPRKPRSCPDARYLARVAKARSFRARQAYERWRDERTLSDFAFADGARAWPRAVSEVQRVFPGTESWLLSCSAAEGGHGRWVGYGGQGYSTYLRDSDTVGGPLQFRYSTFTGMFRRGAEYAQAKGFRIPQFADYTTAWRSALGQAIAGGWARYTGNDSSHWSASWGRGC